MLTFTPHWQFTQRISTIYSRQLEYVCLNRCVVREKTFACQSSIYSQHTKMIATGKKVDFPCETIMNVACLLGKWMAVFWKPEICKLVNIMELTIEEFGLITLAPANSGKSHVHTHSLLLLSFSLCNRLQVECQGNKSFIPETSTCKTSCPSSTCF